MRQPQAHDHRCRQLFLFVSQSRQRENQKRAHVLSSLSLALYLHLPRNVFRKGRAAVLAQSMSATLVSAMGCTEPQPLPCPPGGYSDSSPIYLWSQVGSQLLGQPQAFLVAAQISRKEDKAQVCSGPEQEAATITLPS